MTCLVHVRIAPQSGLSTAVEACPLWTNRDILYCGKVEQIPRAVLLRGAFDPYIYFAAQCHKVDWLGQKRAVPSLATLPARTARNRGRMACMRAFPPQNVVLA